MPINYKSLVEDYKKFPVEADQVLRESLEAKSINPRHLDFGRLFEEIFGMGEFNACRRDPKRLVTQHVFEGVGAVTSNAFTQISGQIVYAMTLEKYESPEYVFTKMIPERQSAGYDFEKVAGITGIGPGTDAEWRRAEQEPYNYAGVGPDWINLPKPISRGKIVPLTREAIFMDRTGQLQDRCSEIGLWLGYNAETRAIDCIIDENDGAKSAVMGGHRYHWQGVSIATYGDNSGTHSWDNLVASNALVDWTDIDAANQVFIEQVDPFTGAPITLSRPKLIVTPSLLWRAKYIGDATKLTHTVPGFATSGNVTQSETNNPVNGMFEIATSPLLTQRLATDTSWFWGDPGKAFVRVIMFPMQTIQAPPNNEAEFNRDIVLQYRADEASAFGTVNPRFMQRNNP